MEREEIASRCSQTEEMGREKGGFSLMRRIFPAICGAFIIMATIFVLGFGLFEDGVSALMLERTVE